MLLLSVHLSPSYFLFLYIISPSEFWSSCLSLPTHIHLPCPHYYIFHRLSLPIAYNHLSLNSLISSLTFATTASALISSVPILQILLISVVHLNIIMSVLSSESCSAFLCSQVTIPYIYNCALFLLFSSGFSHPLGSPEWLRISSFHFVLSDMSSTFNSTLSNSSSPYKSPCNRFSVFLCVSFMFPVHLTLFLARAIPPFS